MTCLAAETSIYGPRRRAVRHPQGCFSSSSSTSMGTWAACPDKLPCNTTPLEPDRSLERASSFRSILVLMDMEEAAAVVAGSSSSMQWESMGKEEEHAREAEEAWEAYLRQQRARRGWAQYLRCRPMSLLGKDHDGNWVVMPASALDRLTSVGVGFPMEFRVQNAATLEASHLGVLEFGCEEGFVHLPAHAMARLGLHQDDLVLLTSVAPLPKATSIRLRPHTADFLRARHHKELLEHCLKNYSMVTVGDTIAVYEGDRRYLVDVVDAKPAHAVSTLDTDCEVDFALPLDYVEPPPVKAAAAAPCQDCAHGGEEQRRFVGIGVRMDGKPVEQTPPPAPALAGASSGKGNNASSEHVLRFSGRRVGSGVAVPPAGAKSAKKKVDAEEDKEAKRFAGEKYTL